MCISLYINDTSIKLIFLKILFLSNCCNQHGARTHHRKIKSHTHSTTDPARHSNKVDFFKRQISKCSKKILDKKLALGKNPSFGRNSFRRDFIQKKMEKTSKRGKNTCAENKNSGRYE